MTTTGTTMTTATASASGAATAAGATSATRLARAPSHHGTGRRFAPASRPAIYGHMAPLNVMHLLAPAAFGGLESVVRALAGGQRARGQRVVVGAIVDAEPHPFVEALRGDGVDTR